jgi:hypothetical protein
MKLKKKVLAASITSICTLALFGCGSDDQDGSSGGSSNAEISAGIAVDGPIARAQVFYDLNGNLEKDSFEPSALTDNNGHYNYNLLTGVDYCSGSEARPEFCLELTSAQYAAVTDETRVIVSGGYDLYTGEPFEGTMSYPARSATGLIEYIAITPLTSMIGDGDSGLSDFLDYFINLTGLSNLTIENLLNLNFLASADEFNAQAFASTYQMHKYVTIIADWVNEHYSELEDNEELPADISALIYRQFRNLNDGDYSTAWDGIKTEINALYDDAGLTQNAAPSTDAVNVLSARLTAVNDAVVAAFGNSPSLGSDLTFDNVKGRIRGVEVVVLKIIRAEGTETAHVSALAALSDPDYLTNLQGDGEGNFNFTQVVEASRDTSDILAAANSAKDTSGSSLSSDMAGKSLEIEDSSERVTAKAAIFFSGDEGASRGNIHLCLKYVDLDDLDNRLDGSYITGSWESIEALNNTVMLRMNYLGGRSAALKKIGTVGDQTEYRLDINNEITKFTSNEDLQDTVAGTEITSSEECTSYLAE